LTFADGIATATISTGHAYRPFQVVEIAGAEQPEYNGSFRVLSTTMTTFTYAVTGAPVSPATTTTNLSAKVAPLGWEKPFAGTSKAAYRSKNPQSPQNILLIDNSLKTPNYTTGWAKWANVGIVEDLSDIDTIVGAQAPYDPNNPTQNWKQVTASQWGWYKWFHARGPQYESNGDSGGGGRNWVLIGDDRLFFLFCTNAAGYGWYGRNSYCFGDLISFKPGDNYATVLAADDNYSGMSNYWSYPGQFNGYGLVSSLDFTGKVLLRNHTQLGNPGPVRTDVPEHQQRPADLRSGPDAVPEWSRLQLVAAAHLRAAGGRPYARHPARDAVDAARPALQRSDHRGQRGRVRRVSASCWSGRSTARKPKARRSRSTSPARGGKP
jgi:hypothetical protein